MADKKKKADVKKKKKSWFTVVASKDFGNTVIGETLSDDKNSLAGKTLKVNLMNLLNDPRKQNINLTFKVVDFKDDRALTDLVKYELIASHIKKITRRSKSKGDDSFIIETKDKVKLRVKPVIVTRYNVQKGVLTALRHASTEYLKEYMANNEFSKLIADVITNRLQKSLKESMKKTYPLDIYEFKSIEVLKIAKTYS